MKAEEAEPEDSDEGLPVALRPYAAGLRPAARPDGVGWQQEMIYESWGRRIARSRRLRGIISRLAMNYDNALSAGAGDGVSVLCRASVG